MGAGAGLGRAGEAVADLDALDRLHAHQCGGQARVELAVPVDVGAEAGRQAEGDYLEDTAEGIADGLGGVDGGDHAAFGLAVQAAHRRGVDLVAVGRAGDGA